MDSKIDPNCPNYETCTAREDCAKERCCMDAEYWKLIWMRRSRIRPKLDIPQHDLELLPHGAICCYCAKDIIYRTDLTVEHLVPKSKGGNNSPENKRPCCVRCNNARNNYSLRYWIMQMTKKIESIQDAEVKAVIFKRIESAKYWITYIESAGSKLYRSEEHYKNSRLHT